MRKLALGVLSLILVAGVALPAGAGTYPNCEWNPDDPGTCLDSNREDITDHTRIIIDGRLCNAKVIRYQNRTLLQLRAFSECLGLTVDWLAGGSGNGEAVINGSVGAQGRGFTARFQPQASDRSVRVVEAGGAQRRYYLDVAPFIEDGSTLVPFRFVTDLANVKVSWTQGDESNYGINQIVVDTNERAEPQDEWDRAAEYVGFTNRTGFYLMDQPAEGWHIYPSTLRHVQSAMELYNGVLKEQNPALDWNGFRVRVQGKYGPVDYRGPVTVTWFTDDEAAALYIHDLAATQRHIKSGTAVITGALSLWLGKVYTVVSGLSTMAGLNVSAWSIWADDWTADVQTCAALAVLEKYKSQRPEGAPAIWGMAQTPNGERCVPYYTDNPFGVMKKV